MSRIFAKSNVMRYSGRVAFAAYFQLGVLCAERYLYLVLHIAWRGAWCEVCWPFKDFTEFLWQRAARSI